MQLNQSNLIDKKLPSSEAISVMGPFIVSKIEVKAFLMVEAFLFLIDRIQIRSDIPSHSSKKPMYPYIMKWN